MMESAEEEVSPNHHLAPPHLGPPNLHPGVLVLTLCDAFHWVRRRLLPATGQRGKSKGVKMGQRDKSAADKKNKGIKQVSAVLSP